MRVSALALVPVLAAQPTQDRAAEMVASIHRYLDKRLAESPAQRPRPTQESRARLKKITGVVDPRVPFDTHSLDATLTRAAKVGEGDTYDILAIRWPVLDGVDGEGLLLQPRSEIKARVVALPDADATPEMLAGIQPGVAPAAQFARRLAESGCLVVIPFLIDRSDTFSGAPSVRYTNQPHREFIHRMAYQMGRHMIGYEVQKVLALVDWFARSTPARPVAVAGYGEGGLIAFMSAAADTRINAALVSGYFQPREQLWREPIYRNVWRQLTEFGDAEIAGLISPRALLIENSPHPRVDGPPPERVGRRGAAPGRIETPSPAWVQNEINRTGRFHPGILLFEGGPGSDYALRELLGGLKATLSQPQPVRGGWRPTGRAERQFCQIVDHVQRLAHQGEFRRKEFFAQLDTASVESLQLTAPPYRQKLWEDLEGRMPPPTEPLAAQTRKIYDTPAFTGQEVLIPLWGDIFAYGILLVPKDLRPGERRPAVVAQHGLEGRPQFLIDPPDPRNVEVYAKFAAELANRGFIVFAPQNPYIGGDTFRQISRKANPLGLTLFSFIIGQHSRILDWLQTLPFVDPSRIGYYGLSYGGYTAMRVPPIETRYAAVVCSGNFNDWTRKITGIDHTFTYVFTPEYEIHEFGQGETFDYAEMAALIAPRPFMVERGHRDGVGIDEWVSSEYAKVRRLYAYLGFANRTEIAYFRGVHQIHGEAAYEFLHRHLNWRKP